MTEKDALRLQAETAMLTGVPELSDNPEAMSPEDVRRMLHELRVHQIELEMKNEELRRAQVELDTARARYFDLYDLAPVAYITVDLQGLILESNLAASGLLGVPRFVMVKRPLSQFIFPDDQDIYYLHRKGIAESASPHLLELRMMRQDGKVFWAHLSTATAQDVDGTPTFRIVITDITERKRMEEALREGKQQHEELASRIRVGIYIARTKPNGVIAFDYASPRLAEIFNVSVEDLLRDTQVVIQVIHPDDLNSFHAAALEANSLPDYLRDTA